MISTALRSLRDRARFLLTAEWLYLAGTAGFIVGILPEIFPAGRTVSIVLVAMGLLLGASLFFRDTGLLINRWTEWEFSRESAEQLKAWDWEVPDLPVKVVTERGTVAINPVLDAVLPQTESKAFGSDNRYQLPADLQKIAPYVLQRMTGKWPFNGPNMGLASDLSIKSMTDADDVQLVEGDFYSFVCSDEIMGWQVRRGDTEQAFRERHLFDSKDRVKKISQSDLNNCIGVSTLAVTRDGHVLLIRQAPRSQSSSGLWAPSGSGTLEPQDFSSGMPLTDAVIAGAERELCEEAGIRAEEIHRSEVIGYGRWLERGAKPEFFCLTWLAVGSDEVRVGNRVHGKFSDERLWTSQVIATPLVGSFNQDVIPEPPDSETKSQIRAPVWQEAGLLPQFTVANEMSVPLELALDAWARQRKCTRSMPR